MTALGEAAIELLLDILDQPEPVLSGPVLADFYPVEGRKLVAAGLLVRDGHEAADWSREHDDAPVALIWSEKDQAFGFFNPLSGWVSVDPERLTRYRVDWQAVAVALRAPSRAVMSAAIGTVSEDIWNFGEIRVPNRSHRIDLVLLRRAHNPQAWQTSRKWLAQNPPRRLRAVLCTTSFDLLPADPPRGSTLIPLRDVMVGNGAFQLDRRAIAARLDTGPQSRPGEPLVVSGDGRQVNLRGTVYRFSKGEQQRRIICLLYDRYSQGERQVATATIVAELGLRSNARIRDYFKKHSPPVMGHLLWEKAGMCGFCLDT